MKSIKKIIALLLLLCIALSAVSCAFITKDDQQSGNQNDNTDTGTDNNDGEGNLDNNDPVDKNDTNDKNESTENLVEYSVTVKGPLGQVLKGVNVFVHLDNGTDYNVCTMPVVTDENGTAKFNLDASGSYSVGLTDYPKAFKAKSGNTRAERYVLDSTDMDIVLELADNYNPSVYRVGDYMADFTITDIDGNEYGLYDILEEKTVVVLNFWFCGCGPCASEFPALNAAYKEYQDKVEVLAINDYPRESYSNVASYEQNRGFDLAMPLFKVGYGSEVSLSRFKSNGYPTTIIIDRYGKICSVHVGAIVSSEEWKNKFEFYSSDSYAQ